MGRSRLIRRLSGCFVALCASWLAASGPALAASTVEISQLGEHERARLVNYFECPETNCVGRVRLELDSQGNRPVTIDVAVAFRRGEALIAMKSDAVALDFDNHSVTSIPLGPDGRGDRRITLYERSPLLKENQGPVQTPVIRVPIAKLAKLRVKITPQ